MTYSTQSEQDTGTAISRRPAITKGSRAGIASGVLVIAAAAALALPDRATATDNRFVAPLPTEADSTSATASASVSKASLLDSLIGRSRKLRARFLPAHSTNVPVLEQLFGEDALNTPGVYGTLADELGSFHLVTMRPFSDKVKGRIGSYRIGTFPSERLDPSENPRGFLEITPSNQDTYVSQHFRLRDFLTKDQHNVWPKYLVLQEPLLDKLELVIDELRSMGVDVRKMRVMSGFRTPQYNAQGVGAGGRASNSRHQYGDAADVYIVNGDRDWMSDINRDGKINTGDARLLAEAAERVEKKYPELVGGIGIYKATSAHGPFVHIDVRGYRARW